MQKFIIDLVRNAGAIVRKGYQTKLNISQKSSRWDLVTDYDVASEKNIIGRIRKKFPAHGILAEESGHMIKAREFWIIDPIDGTTAFTRGLPQFSVCVAFISNNVIKFSAIYAPITEELFFAEKGGGAFLNGRKIHVSTKPELSHAWTAEHISRRTDAYERDWRRAQKLTLNEKLTIMRTGSAQLSGAYTACGRYDIMLTKGLYPWDMAAAALVIREAGGKVTTMDGGPYRWNSNSMLGANPRLHTLTLKALM